MSKKSTIFIKATRKAFTFIEVMAAVLLLSMILAGMYVGMEKTADKVMDQTQRQRAMAVAQQKMELLIATKKEPEVSQMSGRDRMDPEFVWHWNLTRENFSPLPNKPDLSNTVIKATITVIWEDKDIQQVGFEDPSYRRNENLRDGQRRRNSSSDPLGYYDDQGNYVEDNYEYQENYSEYEELDSQSGTEGLGMKLEDGRLRATKSVSKQSKIFSGIEQKVELSRFFAHIGFKPRKGQTVAVPAQDDALPDRWYMDLKQKFGREPFPEEVMEYLMNNLEVDVDSYF